MLELKIFGNEDFENVRTATDKNGTPCFVELILQRNY